MIPCGNNKEFQRSWKPLHSSHNVSKPKRVRDSRRTRCPDVFHTSRSCAHVWEHETWILDMVRLKFKLKFKCVQSTVRTSKCRKVNNEMFRVQILGSHLRSREVYRVCMDIIHSLHERYIFMRAYVRMVRARRHMRSNGSCRRYKGILRFKFTSCTCVRIDGIASWGEWEILKCAFVI